MFNEIVELLLCIIYFTDMGTFDGYVGRPSPWNEDDMGNSLVDQYPITLVHIVGFKIIKN